MNSRKGILQQAIPSLIAIALVETVNIQVYQHGIVAKSQIFLLGWLILQMIPGFVFGYISDRHYRKKALVISQLLGLVGGALLMFYGFETWVLVLISLTFNPMPVARAAFLDNFPKHSMLQIISVTLLAQYIPWSFFDYLNQFQYESVVLCILSVLFLNIFFTIFFFNDGYDKEITKHQNFFAVSLRLPILLTLVAFTLSESTFYLLWAFLETSPVFRLSQSLTDYGTLVGIFLAMLYNRLPHISIISLFYHIGAGTMLIVLFRCILTSVSCADLFVNAMSHYSVIGGLYLPFVTVTVIHMFGSKHKATGAAFVEFGDTIAAAFSPLVGFLLNGKMFIFVLAIVILYFCAAFVQAKSEKIIMASKN